MSMRSRSPQAGQTANDIADAWWQRWVGARPPDGVVAPCYWLLRAVYESELGVLLPKENLFAAKDDWARLLQESAAGSEWRRVEDPQDLDAALVGRDGVPSHVGLKADAYLLHVLNERSGVVLTQLERLASRGHLLGFYRLARSPSTLTLGSAGSS